MNVYCLLHFHSNYWTVHFMTLVSILLTLYYVCKWCALENSLQCKSYAFSSCQLKGEQLWIWPWHRRADSHLLHTCQISSFIQSFYYLMASNRRTALLLLAAKISVNSVVCFNLFIRLISLHIHWRNGINTLSIF